MREQFRSYFLSCAAALAMTPALAQAQTADVAEQVPKAADAASVSHSDRDIVVTGTRIRRDGYDAPVPVSVLGAAEIEAQKPANIADMVRTLPAITAGGVNSAVSSATSTSAGVFGINTINLRGLGASRTLVLLNGQRTVASTFSGLVDVNTFPQELIERVEVVTGGASAQYGSDAIGGVVNFILDEKFKGLKLGADTGITTYGGAHNYRFAATAGLSLLDERLDILLNASYFHQDGVDSVDRPWGDKAYQMIRNPAYTSTNGQPEYLVGSGFGIANRTYGGIINSGPLRGTHFLEDGVTKQLNYGATNAFSNPWMIGGDLQTTYEGELGTTSLVPEEERIGVFNRIAFDVTPDITVYGQFSWNRYEGRANAWASANPGLTIRADNAYLLTQYPQVAAAMQANGLGSVSLGVTNMLYSLVSGPDNRREVFRYVAGAKGEFSLFDRPWSWDAYYQRGVAKTREETVNVPNIVRYRLALDAVFSNGQIVCRSALTDPTNGCVPLDRLGTGTPSAASLAYVLGPEQPWREQKFTQDVASVSFSGELLDLPGGPLAIALGGEWRKEKTDGEVGAASSSGWWSGNYRVNRGQIEVKEGFLEVSLPLFAGLDINGAGRYTDYSTSGSVKTWKVGATYSPIRDVKFRGAYSHDIRAPNMQELFLAGAPGSSSILFPANSPQPGVQLLTVSNVGNPNLKPEKADTMTAGIVVSPSFLPGFSASLDYFDIKLREAINTVGRQQIVDFCYSGLTQFCPSIVFSGGQPTTLLVQPANFAGQHAKGFDIEASYRTPLSAISSSLPGNLSIHAAVTHMIKNVVDNRVFPVDAAGVIADASLGNVAASPSWVYRVSAFYEIDPVTINLVARGFNSGVYSNEWIECTSSCPTSTIFNRTINDKHINGAIYFDGGVSFKVRPAGNETTLSFIVNNILNKDPVPFGLEVSGDWVTNPQAARGLYDTVGRVFRVALTSKF